MTTITPAIDYDRREREIERHLLRECRSNGFLCLKFVSPARGGVPDRIVITPLATVFVEVKRPGGSLEPRQLAVHTKMRRFGAEIHVVDDEPDIDALIAHLHDKQSDQSNHHHQQKAAS